MNLKLKKYQTQNFVNQFLQKKKIWYNQKIRKNALKILKKFGFTKFQEVFIFDWKENLTNTINKIVDNFESFGNRIAEGIVKFFGLEKPPVISQKFPSNTEILKSFKTIQSNY